MIGLIMLVAFLIYVSITVTVTRWIIRFPERRVHKWIVALISLSVFALIPTWDVILGRVYFNYLCETEGGIHVYKTVELGPEYWKEDGTPAFITQDGLANEVILGNQFVFGTESNEQYSHVLNIRRDVDLIIDKNSNEVIANIIVFRRFGGWIVNSIWGGIAGTSCPAYEERDYRKFLKSVFIHSD